MPNTMASIIVCSTRRSEHGLFTFFGACLLAALITVAGWSPLAHAAEIDIGAPQLQANDDGYALSANFSFELNSRLEEAVSRGITLHFLIEFELSRQRWYWLDEKILNRTQTLHLSYNALTRQYRVSTGGLHQSFASLQEALKVLQRLRYWQVVERPERLGLKPGDPYQAALRMRLDTAQLPKPFQIVAVSSRDWNLTSDWKRWQLVLPTVEAR